MDGGTVHSPISDWSSSLLLPLQHCPPHQHHPGLGHHRHLPSDDHIGEPQHCLHSLRHLLPLPRGEYVDIVCGNLVTVLTYQGADHPPHPLLHAPGLRGAGRHSVSLPLRHVLYLLHF